MKRWTPYLALTVFTASCVASANGRYPMAHALRHSNDRYVYAATYGLMLSTDSGQSWYHVCEHALLGYPPISTYIDFFIELGDADGRLLSGSYEGLRVSRDYGCTWKTAPDLPISPVLHDGVKPNPLGFIVDLSAARARSSSTFLVLATLTLKNNDSHFPTRHVLYESSNSGETFREVAEIPTSELEAVSTLDVVPGDPNDLYLTGGMASSGRDQVFWSSTDYGRTWSGRFVLPGTEHATAYIAGVHPQDRNTVFVRVERWRADVNGSRNPDDSLMVSRDAGKTWQEVLRLGAKMLGFAISPDGQSIVLGAGHHGVPGDVTRSADFGLYRASLQALEFQRLTHHSISCLMWDASGLYACASTRQDGFVIGKYLEEANAFEPLLFEEQAKGPLPWNGPGNVCLPDWFGTDAFAGVCTYFNRCLQVGGPTGQPAGRRPQESELHSKRSRPASLATSRDLPWQPILCGDGTATGGAGSGGASHEGGKGPNPALATASRGACGCSLPEAGLLRSWLLLLLTGTLLAGLRSWSARGRRHVS